jgi:hypothetical protein
MTAPSMLKELSTALLCGFAIAGQMCAQEVVVAHEASPNSSARAAPVSKGRGAELETSTEIKSQGREKKSAATTLTLEQMRMAGALAAQRQKKQTPVEQTSSVRGSSLQGAKAATVRPTMLESARQEPAASHPAKAEVSGGQTNVPQWANRALRKKMASGANSPDDYSAPTSAQSAPSELHLTSRDQESKKDAVQLITKEKTAKGTRTVANYSYKTSEGKKESVPVITQYYPKQIVYPFGKVDRHIDGRLMQAATIAQERAHAHSRSMCWHYVKEALLASGVIDSRPKSELARDAAQELVNNYGFKRLSVTDPFAAPIGSVLVYGTASSVGHVELRTQDGFVSDFRSKTPSRRPLVGVYAKL